MKHKSQDVYVVMGSLDRNSGEAPDYPMCITTSLALAKRVGKHRYIQGGDCPIKKNKAYIIDGQWYGPVYIDPPTEKDKEEDKRLLKEEVDERKRQQIIKRAKELGLTDKEIKLLSRLNNE